MHSHPNRSYAKNCLLLGAALLLLVFAPGAMAAQPEIEIKIATMAPENSSLMQIFNEMNADLLKETGGKVGFKMFPGFVMGDEDDVLRKLRIGMINAAVFTNTALTDVSPDLRTLQVPFLFHSYDEVDNIMEKMDGTLRSTFSQKGFEVLGWHEIGFIYFMSTMPIAGLDDLKGKKVWARANTPMAQALIERAGVSSVTINAPDVLMALQTNILDVVYNSPYYALVTQWNTQVKNLTDLPLAHIGGAVIMDKKFFAKIPPPLQETVKSVCARHIRRVTDRVRKDNGDAMDLMFKKGLKRVTPTPEQVKGFQDLSDKAMDSLDPKFFPKDTMAKVRSWLTEFRSGQPQKQ